MDGGFPDVEVQLKHMMSQESKEEEEITILQLGPTRVQRKPECARIPEAQQKSAPVLEERKGTDQAKRGQKNKRKKKEKYRDQDLEEQQLRMEILGSAGDQKIKGDDWGFSTLRSTIAQSPVIA